VGLFIWGYAVLFQPPAGEMTRVVLNSQYQEKNDVLGPLHQERWFYPGNNAMAPVSAVSTTAWQATGAVSSTGRCWEVRLHDKDSEDLAAKRENLEQEKSVLLSKQEQIEDQARLNREHQIDASKDYSVDKLTEEIDGINSTLAQRANLFQDKVTDILKDRLIADGDQILDAQLGQALQIELSTATRPTTHELEGILQLLRQENPGVIDLRPTKLAKDYGMILSVLTDSDLDDSLTAKKWSEVLAKTAARKAPGLLGISINAVKTERKPALTMELMLVEEPIDSYVSPINRVFNLLLALFGWDVRPDHRLVSLEQNLRSSQEINHLRVSTGQAARTIMVTAVLPDSPPKAPVASDPVSQKLRTLLGSTVSQDRLKQTRDFYDQVVKSAAVEKLTVARPIIASAYAPMKYNYMSGYLWMLLMGIVGILLTFVFSRLEARGFVRKVGAEEAQAS